MMVKNKNYIKSFFVWLFKFVLKVILFPFVIIYLIKKVAKKHKDKDKIKAMSLTQIDTLSGVEFENFLCQIFKNMGYSVKTTKTSHDYGADLLISKNGKLSLVQAKCYSKPVGIKAIQEIVGAKMHYNASEAIVATNNYFTKDAEVLALENSVKLIDRTVLEKTISKYDIKIEKQFGTYSAISKAEKQAFCQRYKNMI